MSKPKYTCDMGDPLDMLCEEASEILQAYFKLRRFRADGARAHGYTGPTPVEQLHQEVGDFLALLQHCMADGLLDTKQLNEAIGKKRARVKELFGVDLKRFTPDDVREAQGQA